MPNNTCSVADCDLPIKRRGYCYGHYMKAWRYGTPTPVFTPKWEDIRGVRYGALVVTHRQGMRWACDCDCGRTTLVRSGDLNAGSVSSCGDSTTHRRDPDAGYTAAHDRVRRDRGSIHLHECTDCRAPARHWSYNHTDPDERLAEGLSVKPIAYSLNSEHYSPRCVPCHKRFDLDHINATQTFIRVG